jgi:hypothetical protein
MEQEVLLELYFLKCAVIKRDLSRVLGELSLQDERSEIERHTDVLVEGHLSQIDDSILSDAKKMGEFYRIFYAIENDIRQLIGETMDAAFPDGWWSANTPQAVRDNVEKNKAREESEGIPPRSTKNIDYTTFGELGEIIKENWNIFSGIFSNASKSRVLRVVNRLNLARGPIAHCGILPVEEVVRLKLTVRDWYSLME